MKKTLVVGFGLSGSAACLFLKKRKKTFLQVDSSFQIEWPEIERVVVSPGVPLENSFFMPAKKKRIPIIAEAELGLREFENKHKIIGITGTNGKTTTTLMVTHVLNACGYKAVSLGNIGSSICSYQEKENEILVVELSSYQLESMSSKVFDVACILNVEPDHLDRYPSFAAYRQAKLNIKSLLKKEGKFIFQPKNTNAKTAFEICKNFGISKAAFVKALNSFQIPAHRLEPIKKEGITFYNDSKATNPAAVLFALQQFLQPVILIAGGQDKNLNYFIWQDTFKNKVRKLILYGANAQKIAASLKKIDLTVVQDLAKALRLALSWSKQNDIILLSPGSASFDQFKNYQDRGDTFKKLVHEYTAREAL